MGQVLTIISTNPDRGTCSISCGANKYKDIADICRSCHSTCASCYSGTYNDCLTCPNGGVLTVVQQGNPNRGSCSTSCASNTFLNSSNICENCDLSCSTCVDSSTKCTSCPSPKVLQGNVCLDSCSDRFYSDQYRVCQDCPPYCQKCTSPTICTQCNTPTFLEGSSCVL